MGNLRIQDLSIGDWVQAKQAKVDYDDPGLTSPMKIVAIDNREPKQAYVDLAFDDGVVVHSAFVEDLRPVLITPEILEKNGFVLTGYAIQHNEKNRYVDEDTFIVMSKNEWYCTVNQGFLRDISMYANSVHELQHIWRLAKIDKKIIL